MNTGQWLLSLVGGALWLLCAIGNGAVLRAQLRRAPDAPSPSFVPIVGGIAGVLAWQAAYPTLAVLFALPAWMSWAGAVAVVMLEFGSGPYLLILGAILLGGLLLGRAEEPLPAEQQARIDAAVGCLLGIAVGDALGLPMEGLSRRRLARWYPLLDRHHLVLGRGLCSDDTEHSALVALSVCAAGDDVDAFTTQMRGRLRGWLAALPAGVGLATLRAILKLWLFVPRRWQGVYSAGNGAAMRAPLLGVLFANDAPRLRAFVRASTRLTHTDPKAEAAALAVALAARAASQGRADVPSYLAELGDELAPFDGDGLTLHRLVSEAGASAAAGETSLQFAASCGLERGISGYAYHTVPVALHAWFRHPRDYPAAVSGVIACGGDTDTVAAIVGGIVGAGVGREGLPVAWLRGIIEWPGSTRWLAVVAEAALRRVEGLPFRKPREPFWTLRLLRNLGFIGIVLLHGFRRLLPPY